AECGCRLTCQKGYGAQQGDNCASVAAAHHISLSSFKAMNPGINCYYFFVGQWLCVKGTTAAL
ncbi:unnamed protein product, partial [Linum tenue]